MSITWASNTLNIVREEECHYDHRVSPKTVKISKSESGNILWVKALKYQAVQSDLGWWFLFTCGLPRTKKVGRAIYNVLSIRRLVHISFGIFQEITRRCSFLWKVSDEKSPHHLLPPGWEESLIQTDQWLLFLPHTTHDYWHPCCLNCISAESNSRILIWQGTWISLLI